MSHYKKFSEHRHGRDVAKSRVKGYEDGGSVRRFPISGVQADLTRLRSAQGVESGRIGGISGRPSNMVYGPGLNSRGDVKQSFIRRTMGEDLPHAKGGRVAKRMYGGGVGGGETGIGRLERSKAQAKSRKR